MVEEESIQRIVDDESFKEAMADLVKTHVNMLINSDVDDKQSREICYMRITTVNEIIAHLQSIADGKKIEDNKWEF
jgi:hypothetical protein|tara:strand:- start:403 stop:630 length:228 start_codon:yes stop_codon:yes gene_type:complete